MKYWFLWLIVGVLSILAGIIALANPFAATITAELLIGYSFMAIGLLMLFSAVQSQGWSARIWAILIGIFFVFAGFNLVSQPLEGILVLTLVNAVLLAGIGVFRMVFAFSSAAKGVRFVMILSGVISLALGGMIFAGFPESSLFILGVFLAVELISNGVSLIILSLEQRKETPN